MGDVVHKKKSRDQDDADDRDDVQDAGDPLTPEESVALLDEILPRASPEMREMLVNKLTDPYTGPYFRYLGNMSGSELNTFFRRLKLAKLKEDEYPFLMDLVLLELSKAGLKKGRGMRIHNSVIETVAGGGINNAQGDEKRRLLQRIKEKLHL